jgi:lysophospholipase L1-like esterase
MRALLLALLAALPQPEERIVFLGDSITDGHTLALLVEQALKGPRSINAGVAGDTAAGMRKRLERDVLPRRPTRVVLSVGINDIFHKVTPEEYERDVTAIAARLKEEGVGLLLLTPTILGPKNAEAEKKLGGYIAVLRKIGAPVGEVHALMGEARAAGEDLLEPDQVHLTFAGYRVMARAVLDGLGRKEAEVPRELTLEPMPGIIRQWKIRPAGEEAWKALTLPQPEPVKHWWMDQERRRGFAVELGSAKRYQATAQVDAPAARGVFLNTGASIESVTLNGRLLWKSGGWTGWHAGKERLAARLEAGLNTIEIESGASFFLSVTDDATW